MRITVRQLKGLIKESIKDILSEGFGEEQEAKGTAIRDAVVADFNQSFKNQFKKEPGDFHATNNGGNLIIASDSTIGDKQNLKTLRAKILVSKIEGGAAPAADYQSINYQITMTLFDGYGQGNVNPAAAKTQPVSEALSGTGTVEKIKKDLAAVLAKIIAKSNSSTQQTVSETWRRMRSR